MNFEPFVSADVAAEFLSITRKHLLSLAREGMKGCYPIGGRLRHHWVFKLSELSEAIDPNFRKLPSPPPPQDSYNGSRRSPLN
jgi:hypothetical protein